MSRYLRLIDRMETDAEISAEGVTTDKISSQESYVVVVTEII